MCRKKANVADVIISLSSSPRNHLGAMQLQGAQMDGDLTIQQKKLGYFRTFQFGREKLVVTMRDPSGEFQYSVPYEAIDIANPSTLSIKHQFVKHETLVLLVIC